MKILNQAVPSAELVTVVASAIALVSCASLQNDSDGTRKPALSDYAIEIYEVVTSGSLAQPMVRLDILNKNPSRSLCIPRDFLERGWKDGFSVTDTSGRRLKENWESEFVVNRAVPVRYLEIAPEQHESLTVELAPRFIGWQPGYEYEVSWTGHGLFCDIGSAFATWEDLLRRGSEKSVTLSASVKLRR